MTTDGSMNKIPMISEDEFEILIKENTIYFGYVYSNKGEFWYVSTEFSSSPYVVGVDKTANYYFNTPPSYNVYDHSEDEEFIAYMISSDLITISLGLAGKNLSEWGNNTVKTRAKFGIPGKDHTRGTSKASIYFRKKIGDEVKTPKWLQKITPNSISIPIKKKRLPLNNPQLGAYLGRQVPVAGGVVLGLGIASSVYTISKSDNIPKATTREVGGWAGAWGGAWIGGKAGAITGAWIGGLAGTPAAGVGAAPGAVMGGIIGGFVGSIGGAIGGFFVGSNTAEMTYESISNINNDK